MGVQTQNPETAARHGEAEAQLIPRMEAASRLLNDRNLDAFTHLLDDQFRIPGTRVRFGLDGVIGLVPGLGDIAGGVLSCVIIAAGWVRGVPYVTLLRMLVNLGLDVIVGAIPFLGDAFDIAWKANRRNYALLLRHTAQPRKHQLRDWLFLISVAMGVCVILAVPLVLLVWLATSLQHR